MHVIGKIGLLASLLMPTVTGAPAPGLPSSGSEGVLLQSVPISVAGGRWMWENPRPQGNNLYAVTCPAARVCYGVGEGGGGDGMLVSTRDAGKIWRSTQGGGVSSIACPTTSICYTVGRAVYRLTTADGGQSWRRVERSFPGGGAVRALACPAPATCYGLVGASVYRTHDAGRTWWATAVPYARGSRATALYAMACVTATECAAVGSYDVPTPPTPVGGDLPPCPMGCFQPYFRAVFTTNGWKTWQESVVPRQEGAPASIACPTRSLCYTASGRALVSHDGARRWTAQPEMSGSRISCPGARLCFASSLSALNVTRDGGRTWRPEVRAPRAEWSDIACPTVSRCMAVGWFGALAWTSDGGRDWTGRGMPGTPTSAILYTVTCPSALVCYAGGSSNLILGTKDGGEHWNVQLWSPNNTGLWGLPYAYGIVGISCPSNDHCYAVLSRLNRPFVIATTNGGKTWNGRALPPIPGDPSWWQATSISCPTETVCTIVSEGGWIVRTEDGTRWAVHPPPINQSLTDLTCTDTRSCVAMSRGGVPVVTRDGGSSWVPGRSGIVDRNAYAVASSCPTVSTCYLITARSTYASSAARWDLRRTTNGGMTWEEGYEAGGETGQTLSAIHCNSESVCVLLGSLSRTPVRQQALMTTDAGRSFTEEALGVAEHLSALACAPAGASTSPRCVIVGDYGAVVGMRGM